MNTESAVTPVSLSWIGPCPDSLLEGWAVLRSRMSDDVPMGDLTRTAVPADVEAVRRNERRMIDQGYILVRSLARADRDAVGYTEILLSRHDPEIVHQDDTFVEERMRGRGIGRALKMANLRRLMSLPESDSSRFLQTYGVVQRADALSEQGHRVRGSGHPHRSRGSARLTLGDVSG
jgi:predicted GNAT family acetyltransferase